MVNTFLFPAIEVVPARCDAESHWQDAVGAIMAELGQCLCAIWETNAIANPTGFYMDHGNKHPLGRKNFTSEVEKRLNMTTMREFRLGIKPNEFILVFTSTRNAETSAKLPPDISIFDFVYLITRPDAVECDYGGYTDSTLRRINDGHFDVLLVWPEGLASCSEAVHDMLKIIYGAVGHSGGPRFAVGVPIGHPGRPGSTRLLGHMVYISAVHYRRMPAGNIRCQTYLNLAVQKYMASIDGYDPLFPTTSDVEKREAFIAQNKLALSKTMTAASAENIGQVDQDTGFCYLERLLQK
jgi:hypothetical protein